MKELVAPGATAGCIKSCARPPMHMLCMPKNFSCNMQESGILSAPGGQIMTAAPSSGPAAGIITAARISTGNLASSEPGMDEPADYNIPDAPDPAGGLLDSHQSMHHDQPIAGHHHDLLKVAGQELFGLFPTETCHTHWTSSRFLDRHIAPSTSCTLHICCTLCIGKATACVPVCVQLLLGALASP